MNFYFQHKHPENQGFTKSFKHLATIIFIGRYLSIYLHSNGGVKKIWKLSISVKHVKRNVMAEFHFLISHNDSRCYFCGCITTIHIYTYNRLNLWTFELFHSNELYVLVSAALRQTLPPFPCYQISSRLLLYVMDKIPAFRISHMLFGLSGLLNKVFNLFKKYYI